MILLATNLTGLCLLLHSITINLTMFLKKKKKSATGKKLLTSSNFIIRSLLVILHNVLMWENKEINPADEGLLKLFISELFVVIRG